MLNSLFVFILKLPNYLLFIKIGKKTQVIVMSSLKQNHLTWLSGPKIVLPPF